MATWTVEADFDKDGSYEEDITADVLPAGAMSWNRGKDSELGHAQAGTLTIRVKNATGKYSPENTGSSLSPNVLPGVPIRVKVNHASTDYTVYTGKIEKYVPHPEMDQQVCDILCVDGIDQLSRTFIEAPVNTDPYTNVKLGADPGPVETVLDQAGWPAADRTLDAGVDALDVWWAHKETALDALHKLERAELAFMYVDGSGKFVYEDRHHRLGDAGGGATDHLTSQATFDDTMVKMDYEFSARTVRNIITVRGHKLTLKSEAYVWETQDTPSIEPGQFIELWLDLPNPVADINGPAINVDYDINSNAAGTGDDESANVSVTQTQYGQAVKHKITNNATHKVYVVPGTSDPEHTLRVPAKEYEDNTFSAREEDSTSKTAYGERTLEIDVPFKGNWNDIQAYADYLKQRFKDPQPDFVRMTVVNKTDALWTQILARQLSDRITVTEADLGISSQDYFIQKMEHRVSDGGKRHEVTWSLSRTDEEVFWAIGVAGYSEIGQTTYLVF